MFNHLSIGVRDLNVSRKFYDAALMPLGYELVSKSATELGYGEIRGEFWVYAVQNPIGNPSDSGLRLAFKADNRAAVESFYFDGIAGGGSGASAPTEEQIFGCLVFSATLLDPDGYVISARFSS